MNRLTIFAKLFLSAVAACGVAVLGLGAWNWACFDYIRFLVFLVLTAVASMFKVRLPGMTTTMSVNVPLVLIALVELGFSQAVIIGGVSTAVQCLWKTRSKPQPVQVLFNVCNTMNAIGLASMVLARWTMASPQTKVTLVVAASGVFLLASTMPVAIIVGLTEGKRPWRVWPEILVWTFPYYVLSAGVAVTAGAMTGRVGWQAQLVILALMYGVYRSYRRYVGNAVLEPAVAAGHAPSQVAQPAVAMAATTTGRG